MLKNLSETNSILGAFLRELRDKAIQTDRMKFRNNLRRVGQYMAFEISKTLEFTSVSVTTQLGTASCQVLKDQPVLATVLRAGLPMHEGFLEVFDGADNAFVAASRQEGSAESIAVNLEYAVAPKLDNRLLIFCDPMLATGTSMLRSLEALQKYGTPKRIIVAAVFSSAPGIKAFQKARPDVELWTAAVDPELNSKAYIVPGLGDAGDLALGDKL
jgi:uracil phosphoribosyltransferase